jgi:hypothetical protein
MLKFSPVTSYGLMSGLDPLTFYEWHSILLEYGFPFSYWLTLH